MEWWLAIRLPLWLPPLVGVIIGSILTYFFTRLGASQERKSIERAQLRSAVRSILVEVETNLNLSKEPFQGILIPFVTQAWDSNKGCALGLPKELQDTLYRVYVEIQMANALFQLNLKLPHGMGYYNNAYKQQANKIAKEAEKARKLLVEWLEQESVEVVVVNEDKRQGPQIRR